MVLWINSGPVNCQGGSKCQKRTFGTPGMSRANKENVTKTLRWNKLLLRASSSLSLSLAHATWRRLLPSPQLSGERERGLSENLRAGPTLTHTVQKG